ncbi:MAG: DivIVA domain-containing protein [Bacilli bacterium]|jgi:DivIVA domain-containing protein
MKKKLFLTPEKIYETKFTPNVKGYNALEVDEMLDLVIKDYQFFESYTQKLESALKKLENEFKKLQKKATDLEAIVTNQKEKLDSFEKATAKNNSNLELIKKVGIYESKLYELGYDPNKLK